MKATHLPSGETLGLNTRSWLQSNARDQPLGGLESGRGMEGQPLYSNFSVRLILFCMSHLNVIEFVPLVYHLSTSMRIGDFPGQPSTLDRR
jgi:hypothetical protein